MARTGRRFGRGNLLQAQLLDPVSLKFDRPFLRWLSFSRLAAELTLAPFCSDSLQRGKGTCTGDERLDEGAKKAMALI